MKKIINQSDGDQERGNLCQKGAIQGLVMICKSFGMPVIFCLCLALWGLSSCSTEDKEEPTTTTSLFEKLADAEFAQVTYPHWLSEKIENIEVDYHKIPQIVLVRIYRGRWHNNIVYFIYSSYSSTFGTFYDKVGKKIDFTEESFNDFELTSHDWHWIYEF